MKHRTTARAAAAIAVYLCLGPISHAQTAPQSTETPKETAMTRTASGSFEVKLTPQAPDDGAAGSAVGRMLLDKQFHGDLEAVSKGQMLAIRTAVDGSAGYVAIEEVDGTLNGRRGTFVLQHSSTMARGTPRQSITVVPDSGTDQLVGLAGTMSIDIREGGHFYSFEYTLAEAP